MQELFLGVTFLAIAVASYTDIRTREVPDWVNYSLLAFGLGGNLLLSIAMKDFSFILYSIAGAAAMFGIACAMYYTGQWGGGDSKLLIGMGAMLGIPFSLELPYISLNGFLIAGGIILLVIICNY